MVVEDTFLTICISSIILWIFGLTGIHVLLQIIFAKNLENMSLVSSGFQNSIKKLDNHLKFHPCIIKFSFWKFLDFFFFTSAALKFHSHIS